MKPTVYLETTIIGYLAMRLSRDLLVAANQQLTRDWWDNHRHKYELVISRFVIDECAKGDPTAAQERRTFVDQLPNLELPPDVKPLADALISRVPLPAKATLDALHISAAAINSVEYLLTWKLRWTPIAGQVWGENKVRLGGPRDLSQDVTKDPILLPLPT